MSLLNVEKLSHGFGDKAILKDISVRLLKGEHVGLIGANGAGKTTFLNILSGKLLQDEGTLLWANDIRTGYLEQVAYLEDLTIRQVLQGAYAPLYKLEKEILDISEKLETAESDDMDRMVRRLGWLQDELDRSNFYRIDGLIEDAAGGLGLLALGLDTPVSLLSGGQKTKVTLARLLLEKPDILLLDEPTNYLDTEHIRWLSAFLADYPGSFILVSHDLKFLNSVTNVIWHIEFNQLKRYPGNYEKFLKLSEQNREQYLQDYTRQQALISKMEDFIQKNMARASTTGRAKSRLKALEKLDRLDKPQIVKKPAVVISEARESDKIVFETLELEVGYDKPLLPLLDLRLERGQKVAITGFNGIGKTTLLKTLLNLIPARNGLISFGDFVHTGYFAQEEKKASPETALELIWRAFPKLSQQEIRKRLALMGLTQEHIMMPVKSLSGGERAKVRLCQLMLKPSNFLVLDEPTNHLDKDIKQVLADALQAYRGAVLVVCHEEAFYKDWVDTVWNLEKLRQNAKRPALSCKA
ncbi:MAG: ATP-binding cassette domain-containing protein [Clostridia bacterium]|nr:ATP-binding cassette domain-containing protein [Clostridia bacterium]